jgi:hypothetical protein
VVCDAALVLPQSRTPKELEARFKQLVRLIEKELETEDQVPHPSPVLCLPAACFHRPLIS